MMVFDNYKLSLSALENNNTEIKVESVQKEI